MIKITSSAPSSPPGDFGSVFNNVFLFQGFSSDIPIDCTQPTGDIITIDETTVVSNLLIFQNAILEGITLTRSEIDTLAEDPAY